MIEQVRGKGSNKTKTIFGEDDDEETHVLITGPGTEAVEIARKLVGSSSSCCCCCSRSASPSMGKPQMSNPDPIPKPDPRWRH